MSCQFFSKQFQNIFKMFSNCFYSVYTVQQTENKHVLGLLQMKCFKNILPMLLVYTGLYESNFSSNPHFSNLSEKISQLSFNSSSLQKILRFPDQPRMALIALPRFSCGVCHAVSPLLSLSVSVLLTTLKLGSSLTRVHSEMPTSGIRIILRKMYT